MIPSGATLDKLFLTADLSNNLAHFHFKRGMQGVSGELPVHANQVGEL